MDAIPIWLAFAGTFLIVMAGSEAGYWLAHFIRRRSADGESSDSTGTGAILGLSAFMLAFTFGIVSERYSDKKALVRQDANAIRTAWQRSDFLPEADRAEAKTLLKQYVDQRLAFTAQKSFEAERVASVLAQTKQLQDRLWDMAVANARKDMNSDVAALYLESLNEIFAVHATRVAVGIQARIPGEVWLVLLGITILGMISMGYHTKMGGAKRSLRRPALAVAFALVFGLTVALDRPGSGILSVTQQPLVDLRDSMIADAERALRQ